MRRRESQVRAVAAAGVPRRCPGRYGWGRGPVLWPREEGAGRALAARYRGVRWMSPPGGRGTHALRRGRGRRPARGRGRCRSPSPRGGRLGAPCGGSQGAEGRSPVRPSPLMGDLSYGLPRDGWGAPAWPPPRFSSSPMETPMRLALQCGGGGGLCTPPGMAGKRTCLAPILASVPWRPPWALVLEEGCL